MFRVVQVLASVCFLGATVLSLVAFVTYMRQPGARWIGFGYARYFYGDYRRTRPALFWGLFVAAALGMVAMYVSNALFEP